MAKNLNQLFIQDFRIVINSKGELELTCNTSKLVKLSDLAITLNEMYLDSEKVNKEYFNQRI